MMTEGGDALSRVQLRAILSMVRDSWIRDFLLESNPYKDLRILTSPFQSLYSISGDHELKVNKNAFAGEPRKRSRWLLVPVRNRGSCAAGLFIQHQDNAMHFVRFVRDDDTGEVLYITDIPGAGCTEVMHNKQTSSTVRQSSYLRFGTDQFRRAFDTSYSDSAVNALTEAMLTSCNISETRNCPNCKGPACMRCSCVLPFRRAKHDMDFRHYRFNTANMFGRYMGCMTLSTYSSGQERSSQVYGVETFTRCTPHVVTHQMLNEAVQQRLSHVQLFSSGSLIAPGAVISAGAVPSPSEKELAPDWFLVGELVDTLMDCESLSGTGTGSPPHGVGDTGSGAEEDPLPVDLLDFDDIVDYGPEMPENLAFATDHTVSVGHSPRGIGAPRLLPKMGRALDVGRHPPDPHLDRKIRKREAAARSNDKRHRQNAALKEQLAAAKRKLLDLRRREDELKEENRVLREQVKSRSSSTISAL